NFYTSLVDNTNFTTYLAGDSNFITELTTNSSFITNITNIVTGGGGVLFQTDGVDNGSQAKLNLIAGLNVNLTDDGFGNITIDASGGSSSFRSYTATIDINAKDLVGISDGIPGSVAIAARSLISSTSGLGAVSGEGLTRIDTDKYAFLFLDGTDLKAVICSLNSQYEFDNFGTPVVVATSVVTGSNQQVNITQIGTDKFMVVRQILATNTITQKVTGATVSGTVITLGTEIDVATVASVGSMNLVTATSANTDEAMLTYQYVTLGSSNNLDALAITFSGTVPTAGSGTTIDTNGGNPIFPTFPIKTDTSTYFGLYKKSSGSDGTYMVVITQSGTTLTVGTPVQINGQVSLVFWATNYATLTPLISYQTGTSVNAVALVSITGTVPTLGTPVPSMHKAFTDGTDVWIGNLGSDPVQRYTVSGTTMTPTADLPFAGGVGDTGFSEVDGKIFDVLNTGTVFQVYFWGLSLSSDGFIGVALQTVNQGDPVLVQITGEATVNTITAIAPGMIGKTNDGTVIGASSGDLNIFRITTDSTIIL
ncbi:MAG: hypothetical protein V4509_00720, partial [Patescibacteria group bacterium]